MRNLTYQIKKYFSFSESEIRALGISILVMAFIFSAARGGPEDVFVASYWVKNFFVGMLIAMLALIVHQTAQRVVGLSVGFRVEYRLWLYGIFIGLVIAVISKGAIWFLAPGGILVYHMAGHRLGSFRYGLNYWPLGMTGLAGPLANIGLALIFKVLLVVAPGNIVLLDALKFNLYFAVFSMLPVPPLDGSHLFFASRMTYVFAFCAMVAGAIAMFFLGIFVSLLLAVVVGAGCWFGYYWFYEA